MARDDAPFSSSHPGHLHLFPIVQRYNVIQKLEQCVELFELSILFLTKVGQLVRIFLADRRVEFGECIACRGVSDGPALASKQGIKTGA